MVRPDRDRIGGEYIVEVDETAVGGHTRGQGRGVHRMATVVGAVEVRRGNPAELQRKRTRQKHDKGRPVRGETYAGRLRLRHVPPPTRSGSVCQPDNHGTTYGPCLYAAALRL